MEVRQCSKNDSAFLKLREELYRGVGYSTVPEPSGEYLHECFVVEENGGPLSRAALFNNPHLAHDQKRWAQVGSFESKNDPAAVNLLMQAIADEARSLGYDGLLGPMNASTWSAYRFSIQQQKPFFTEPYHLEYYPKLWMKAGFEIFQEYFSSITKEVRGTRLPDLELPQEVSFRNLNLDEYEWELERIHRFCTEAFAQNFLFSPISLEDFKMLYRPLKNIMDPQLVLLAEDSGELVGMVFCLPDFYDPPGKTAVIKTLARKPGTAYMGLGNVLAGLAFREAQQQGYRQLVHAFMLSGGRAKKVSGSLFGQAFREHVLFKKEI